MRPVPPSTHSFRFCLELSSPSRRTPKPKTFLHFVTSLRRATSNTSATKGRWQLRIVMKQSLGWCPPKQSKYHRGSLRSSAKSKTRRNNRCGKTSDRFRSSITAESATIRQKNTSASTWLSLSRFSRLALTIFFIAIAAVKIFGLIYKQTRNVS